MNPIASRIPFLSSAFAAAVGASVIVEPSPTAAQAASPVGQWQCYFGTRNPRGGAAEMRFAIAIGSDGSAYGQGAESSAMGMHPFRFQGRWQMNRAEFLVQGQQVSDMGLQPFFFSSTIRSQGQMSAQANFPNGNVVVTTCQRMG